MGIVAKSIFERQGKDYDAKLEELSNFSDIQTVQRIANKLNLGEVYPSNRKDKKYMINGPSFGWSSKYLVTCTAPP